MGEAGGVQVIAACELNQDLLHRVDDDGEIT
jgi:hypothetical protein